MKMKSWKIGLILALVGVAGLLAAVAVSRAAVSQSSERGFGGMMGFAADQRQDGAWRGGGRAGGCGALMGDPQALKEMQALRVEHRREMQAWFDTYGKDPRSTEAQGALRTLREEHRNDMRGLFDEYGVEPGGMMGPGGSGPGGCGGAGAGGCGGPGGWDDGGSRSGTGFTPDEDGGMMDGGMMGGGVPGSQGTL